MAADASGFLYRAFYVEDAGAEGGDLKEVEYATAEEALRNACRDIRAGYRPVGIWAPDRSLVHSAAAVREHCQEVGQSDPSEGKP